MVKDVFRSITRLLREPRFFLVLAVTLSPALGAVGGGLSLLSAVTLRSINVEHAGSLVVISQMKGAAVQPISLGVISDFAEGHKSLESVCGYSSGSLKIEVDGSISRRQMEAMTAECSAALSLKPSVGELISSAASTNSVVITDRFWKSEFGRSPSVIGSILRVEGRPLTIIGVTTSNYTGLDADRGTDIILSLQELNPLLGSNAEPFATQVLGRLREGQALTSVERTALEETWRSNWASHLNKPRDDSQPRVDSAALGFSQLRRDYGAAMLLIVSLFGSVLALATLSAAGMCLSRTLARSQQLSIQLTLGASRVRIALMMAAEYLMPVAVATVASLPFASWLSSSVATLLWTGSAPLTMAVQPDAAIIMSIVGISLLVWLLMIAPSLIIVSRWHFAYSFSGNRSVTNSSNLWRNVITISQVAVSLCLLGAASSFAHSLSALQAQHPGYRVDHLSWSRLESVPSAPRGDGSAYLQALFGRLETAGATGAAVSVAFPTTELRHLSSIPDITRGDASREIVPAIQAKADAVSPNFFNVSGISLQEGRDFNWADTQGHQAVAILSRSVARRLFPEGEVLGRSVRIGSNPLQMIVVGICADASPGDPRIPAGSGLIFQPILQQQPALVSPVLLVHGEVSAEALRAAVGGAGRHYVVSVRSISQQLKVFSARERALALISTVVSSVGGIVAGVGLFGLLTFFVITRAKELAIRKALGADLWHLGDAAFREPIICLGIGGALGVLGTVSVGYLVQSLLYEVAWLDPLSIISGTTILVLLVAIASVSPVHRLVHLRAADALRRD